MKMDQTTFGSVPVSRDAFRPGQMPARLQTDGEKHQPGKHQPAGDDFEPLNRRHQRQHGAEFVEFQIMLLRQKHSRRRRAETESAVGEQDHRGVQTGQRAGKFRLRPARRIQRRASGRTRPTANNTGEANAPRNRSRGNSPTAR